jgi:putative transposase
VNDVGQPCDREGHARLDGEGLEPELPSQPRQPFTLQTANVLNKLPKGLQAKAKQQLHAIWMAETRQAAEAAFDAFVDAYAAKYDKAVACLVKDRQELLTFYDFPAEHWKHVRTTNPVESTFATVRLRTTKTKGCLSRRTALTMVFRLCQSAERRWRRLDGPARLAEVARGARFVDGKQHIQDAA